MPRPDLLFYNCIEQELVLVEGKIEKCISAGLSQLSDVHLASFIDLIKNAYPECTIRKALCITIDAIENLSRYDGLDLPVVFAIDNKGKFISCL
jgi:hypothetical protein